MLFPEVEVTKSLSRNLLKVWNVSPNPEEEVRVIDNNEVVARRIEWLAGQELIPPVNVRNNVTGETPGMQQDAADSSQEEQTASGFVQGIVAEPVETYTGPSVEELIAQAQEDAKKIVDAAKEEADGIRIQAQEEGRQQGFASGFQEAQEKLHQQEEELRRKEAAMEEAYWAKLDELEPQFVDTLIGIFEHILHVKYSDDKQLILTLLEDALRGMDSGKDFLIHISPADYPAVRAAKGDLVAVMVMPDAQVEIIEDVTLSKNECLIETGSGIYDCSLGTQMDELVRQLRLLSYEK